MQAKPEYYERYWSEEGVAPAGTLLPAIRRVLDTAISEGSNCLDLGCGDGRAAGPYLLSRGGTYVGADVSREALERARTIGLDTRLIEDASDLPWDDGTFDAIVCFEVLEHLFDPQAALREARRVLAQGGV